MVWSGFQEKRTNRTHKQNGNYRVWAFHTRHLPTVRNTHLHPPKKNQMKVTLCLKWKSDASLGKNEELGESTTSTIKRLQTQAYTPSCHCEVVVTVKTVFQVVLGSTYWPQIIGKVLRSTSGFKRYHTSVSASLGWCMLVSPFTKFLFIKWKNYL